MAAPPPTRCTPEEYLARERAAQTRSEYYAGEVFAMADPGPEHGAIVFNVGMALSARLRRPCVAYGGDRRLRIRAGDLYAYPDVAVVCGTHTFEDGHLDTLLNPIVIVEVLSPWTEVFDRGRKRESYQNLDSLTDCLLIAADRVQVEHYARQAGGEGWRLSEASDPGGVVHLASLGCDLALSEIYDPPKGVS